MKKMWFKKLMILPVLILSVLISVPSTAVALSEGSAAVEPRESQFISSYSGGIGALSGGKVQVSFSVVGMGKMDRIGATKIVIQESTNNSSWTPKYTYNYTSYSNMMASNRTSHASDVTYSGTVGRYYRAVITIYSEKDGGCDSRLKTTSSVKAKT